MTPIFSAPFILDNIHKHLLSENRFDRHIRTRVDVVELFLRVAFKAGSELLYAVARIPLATIKWVLNQVNRGHLLTASLNFSEIIAHLQQSKQCTAALVCDFPAIFINPKTAQTRLLNRHLIHVEIPRPTLFESLTKHLWTRRTALIGTTATLAAALVIHRIGLLHPPAQNPNPPESSPSPPQSHANPPEPPAASQSYAGFYTVAFFSTCAVLGWRYKLPSLMLGNHYCAQGYNLYDKGDYDGACTSFRKAQNCFTHAKDHVSTQEMVRKIADANREKNTYQAK